MNILLFQASCRWHSDMLMDKTNIAPYILQVFVSQIKKNTWIHVTYIVSLFLSPSLFLSISFFLLFQDFYFSSTLFTTLNIYRYGKAYFFPIYEKNVPSRALHEQYKTEKDVDRHSVELSLVYARFEILIMLLRVRSWEVKPRQLVNNYKEVRRIVVP